MMKVNKIKIVSIGLCFSLLAGFAKAQTVTVDCGTEYQKIRGFGGMNMPSWISDLTTEQTNLAFGNADGQIGLSILRVKVPSDAANFYKEYPTAARARNLGAIVFATPWSPPAALKSNSNIVGGVLNSASYGSFTDHLLNFAAYMKNNGAPLYAVSLQNEPDYSVTYESCSWYMKQMINFLKTQGSRFDTLRIIGAESFQFKQKLTDSILNDAEAGKYLDIVGGHIYGGGLADYPLSRTKEKEVWMTEHFTESLNSGNAWPLALDVATELHNCMVANFNAYVWWYIRRSYGLIDESGNVTKRGYLMTQYSKFIRPGFVRVSATQTPINNISVTAYKSDTSVVLVVVNRNTTAAKLNFNLQNAEISSLKKFTTSETKNVYNEGTVSFSTNSFSSTVDAESVTTFVSKRDIKSGVEDISIASNKIKTYPNPAKDILTLYINENIDSPAKGAIYNRLGMLISEFNFTNQQFDLPVNQLPKDIYFIKVNIKNEVYYQKFIKN